MLKKLISSILAIAMIGAMSTSVFAEETAEVANTSSENAILDGRTDISTRSGFSNVDESSPTPPIGSDNGNEAITPYVNRQVIHTFTSSSSYENVYTDNPLFNERIKVTVDALGDNIGSVLMMYKVTTSLGTVDTQYGGLLYNGDSYEFDVGALSHYSIWFKVYSGSPSPSNPGNAVFHIDTM